MTATPPRSLRNNERWNTVLGGTALLALVLVPSYCSELPKYNFERDAAALGREMPGARLIATQKSGDLASPVSWFWPATTYLAYAVPDPLMKGRFTLVTLIYEEKPITFLVDTDCEKRDVDWYALDEPETALPALDLWGQPVKTREGRTYRRFHSDYPLPANEIHALCDTDWKVEREAVGNYIFGKKK